MSTFQLPFEESERNILLIEKSARHQRNIHANREHPINYLLKINLIRRKIKLYNENVNVSKETFYGE